MSQELLQRLEMIEREKNISKEFLLEALKAALQSACRKTFPDREGIEVDIDLLSGDIRLTHNGKAIRDANFGRIAAQTAKQVIIQKIREAERENIFDTYTKRIGEIINGTVHRFENRTIIVDLGKTEAILPPREQFAKDIYRQGDTIRAVLREVKRTPRGPELILSRSHEDLVKRLFELEVPEIHEGIVKVMGISREAGSRTKIAVTSSDDKVDCVGSCVGMRGQRVKNIVRELGGEKIDIVRYSEDTETYIRNAMSPAELGTIKLNPERKEAEIYVEDEQLSLAIGKKGQNVRLASKLTQWQLDVRSRSQRIPIASLKGVGPKTEELLRKGGICSLKDILKSTSEDLAKIEGISQTVADKIIAAAHEALMNEGPS